MHQLSCDLCDDLGEFNCLLTFMVFLGCVEHLEIFKDGE